MKRTTIVLPDELHERLRREAFLKRTSVSRLIRNKLDGKPDAAARRRQDPLLVVSGIGRSGRLTQGIDEALYGR